VNKVQDLVLIFNNILSDEDIQTIKLNGQLQISCGSETYLYVGLGEREVWRSIKLDNQYLDLLESCEPQDIWKAVDILVQQLEFVDPKVKIEEAEVPNSKYIISDK